MRHAYLALAALLLLPPQTDAWAQNGSSAGTAAAAREARAPLIAQGVRIAAEAPTVDGRLDDTAWQAATPLTGFVQMRPSPGEAATERTEVRVLYDDQAIYVGMRMYDRTPEEVAAQLGRRDASGIHSDWAHVIIDSYHDRRTGFRFSVNPRGVMKDVLHFDDHSEDVNWDAVWEAAAVRDEEGWTAELRIPLSQLRFSPATEETEMVWGINFGREIARRGEWSWWSPVLPTTGGMVSQSGELHGLRDLRPGRRLEVLPYSVARLTRAPGEAANPFHSANDPGVALGGDVRYGLTSELTLSATFNPDFGQVEADPSQVNLSGLESFFSEKRPFFLEGSNIFRFGIGTDDGSGEGLFYSRRIGRVPQRSVQAPSSYVSAPDVTRILGAGKVSGKTANGWTVGLLNAVTAPEEARIAAFDGTRTTTPVEPLTNYSVMSLSRDFRQGQSTLGILGTATHRRLNDEGALSFLTSQAYSSGVRGQHQFAGRTWEANFWLAGSHVRGSEAAITRVQLAPGRYFHRPDADHLTFDSTRTSLSGTAANFGLWKFGGSKIRGGFGGHVRSPGFEVNDLGFMGETDQALLYTSWRYQQYEPQGIFRNWSLGINPSVGWTTGGEHVWSQVGHWANYELKNFWNGGWWVGYRPEALATLSLRGGPATVRPAHLRYNAWLNSDRRKPLRGGVSVWGQPRDEAGRWDYGVGGGLTFRPSSQLSMAVNPSYNRTENTWQYVAQPELAASRDYVFGRLSHRTVSVTTRLDYIFSPTVSFQFYAQPFVSAGEYTDFLAVADPRAAAFADRFVPIGHGMSLDPATGRYRVDRTGDGVADYTLRRPDFNFKQLNSNAVLRWEYRPGSTLFVVWNQGRTDFHQDGSFDASRDFGRLLGMERGYVVEPTNTLLVKVSYWLNP
jgi:hypothetical protein